MTNNQKNPNGLGRKTVTDTLSRNDSENAKTQSRSLYGIFSSRLGLKHERTHGSNNTEGLLTFLFPAIVVILIVVLSAVIKQEIDRMLLEEKLIEKRFEISLITEQVDSLLAKSNDWEDARDRYLNTILINIEMLDKVDMTYAAVFDEQLQNLSARSPSYEGSPFEPTVYPEFVEAVRTTELGDLTMAFTPPGSQTRPMYLHYRWVPSDKAIRDRVLLVTAISKFSLNASISTWVQVSTIVLVLLSFAMTLFVWRKQALRNPRKSLEAALSPNNMASQKDRLARSGALSLKGHFLAQMNRKLQMHLDTIVEQSSIVQRSCPDTNEAYAASLRISEAAVPLTEMLNDMNYIASIRSGTFALDIAPFSLKALLNQVVDATSPQVNEKRIQFATNVGKSPDWTLNGDRVHLNQVLTTLLGNAIKYSNPGGEVRFRVDAKMKPGQESAQITFTIVDQGAGLEASHFEMVYDAFTSPNKVILPDFEDVGVGLTISCALVSLMGGTITVQSEENKGSVFEFSIIMDRVQ